MQVAPLAAAFVGYVVFWNLSLQVNSVGFYQLSKIMVLPTVAALEVSTTPTMNNQFTQYVPCMTLAKSRSCTEVTHTFCHHETFPHVHIHCDALCILDPAFRTVLCLANSPARMHACSAW